MKTKTLFTRPVICGGETVWDGEDMLKKVKNTAVKNTAHFTKYAFFKKGGLFDQMPVKASEYLVPLKKNLPTEKYGGYNKSGIMFYIPARYKSGRKTEVIILSVELSVGERFLKDEAFAREYAVKRINTILRKSIDEVSFPMGMRPWKVNTVLSLDGFYVCITGISSYGKCLSAQPIVQFSAEPYWQYYIKRLDSYVEKTKKNANYYYDETYDKVNSEKNKELYDIYISKMEHSIYKNRINLPLDIVKNGRDRFGTLSIKDQAICLLNLHQVFGRMTSGCDLTIIGGSKNAGATISFSSTLSNWKKKYSDVRIIDMSTSGLWERRSDNLLEVL